MVKLPGARTGPQVAPDLAVSGQVVVSVQPGVSDAALQASLQAKGCTLLHRYTVGSLALIKLPAGTAVTAGVTLLQSATYVSKAEPDRLMYLQAIPNDPLYPSQWQWPLVSAPQGWDMQTGNPETVVAIVDSGIQTTHPDLMNKIWVNPNPGSDPRYRNDINGWNFVDQNNIVDPVPDKGTNGNIGHGTHVAGLVGATTNNGEGVAGANWQCMLMPLKVFPSEGSSPSSVILEGFEYAVNHGANVINLSLGGGYSAFWSTPITEAYNRGIVVVAAAGNESWVFTDDPLTWSSPVCNDGPNFGDNHVLGVAACDKNKGITFYSNLDGSSHQFVDVTAPGGDASGFSSGEMLSTWPFFPTVAGFGMEYNSISGTSMACPVVAGLASLVQGARPTADAGTIINLVRNSCTSIDAQNPTTVGMMGAGLINFARAFPSGPPGPARNVQAADTPGDEGGSITVTWSRSVDDGGGQNNVSGYEVLRADAATGPFTLLKALPAGSTSYVDTPVVDGTPYWYRVDTRNPNGVTLSAVAGPASARDDLPPPAVETLTVIDTPSDNGGSLTLDWAGYVGSSDLAKFRIYRATANFTDVSAMTPLTELNDPTARHYVDDTTTDGVSYWYAVTGLDDGGNENKAVVATGPTQSFLNVSLTYPSGVSMISVPLTPQSTDMGLILGITAANRIRLARWDPVALQYADYATDPSNPLLQQALGRGFWMSSALPLTVNLAGSPAPAGNISLPLTPGWLMLGNPFTAALTFGSSRVVFGGTNEDLDTSNANGDTNNYAWAYDGVAQSYRLISASLPFATRTVGVGQGLWFRSRIFGTLLVKRPAGALSAPEATVSAPPTSEDWFLRLAARTAAGASTDNFLGVSPQATQLNGVALPPTAEGGVQLSFGGGDQPTATSFVKPQANQPAWPLQVTAPAGAEVTLSWPDLTTLPNSVRPLLTDLATGRSIYLRTVGSYQFTAGRNARQFKMTLVSAGPAMLSQVSAQNVGGGAQIVWTLSNPAQVTVEILNIGGRLVRQIGDQSVSPAGVGSASWDGRNTVGALVPSGVYLVRVTAQADTGQRSSLVQTLSLRR
jgi:hypothetical protein